MTTPIRARTDGGSHIELVEFVDVSYPAVKRLMRHRARNLFAVAEVEGGQPDRGWIARGSNDPGIGTDVDVRVIEYSSTRFPVASTKVSIECSPVQAGRFVEGMTADITAYPISRTVTGITLEGTYRPARTRSPGRLLVHRAVRGCVEDLLDRLVRAIRVEAASRSHA